MFKLKSIPAVSLFASHINHRRRFLFALAAIAPAMLMGAAHSQTAGQWPTKAIHIVAAQAPGSSNDVTARALADYLGQELGVSAVVENKAGGVSISDKYH